MMKNKVKEVVKTTINDALSDQFDTITGAVLSVNKKAESAKKVGIIGTVVGVGALICSIAVSSKNDELTHRINVIEKDIDDVLDRMDYCEYPNSMNIDDSDDDAGDVAEPKVEAEDKGLEV